MELFCDESYEECSRYEYHNAAEAGDAEALQSCIQRRMDMLAAYQTAEAAHGGPVLDVKRLLELDVRDDDECTPLHIALLHGHHECVRVLLSAGASARALCEGSPPLHVAACMGSLPAHRAASLQSAALLCECGASAFDRDDNGRTALHWAALAGHEEMLTFLLQSAEAQQAAACAAALEGGPELEHAGLSPQGPLADVADDKHNTALHLAARYCQPGTLAALLKAATADSDAAANAPVAEAEAAGGAPAEAPRGALRERNKAGHTPLHMAALAGCLDCVRRLVAAAPDLLTAADRRGRTPVDLARRRGHPDAVLAALQAAEPAPGGAAPPAPPPTLLVTSPDCLAHHTCPPHLGRGEAEPPPENINRLHALVDPSTGILRSAPFEGCYWAEDCEPAAMTDVLRVHEWEYVTKLQEACKRLAADPRTVGHLDADTAISSGTFKAALKAAGAVCHAVDEVIEGRAKRAFCAVRPPGHHAGPTGVVSNSNEQAGSHGFCLLNNVTIGAAYALSMYRHRGIKRVALLDFDVHHGNGTEACVINTAPSTAKHVFRTPYSTGVQTFHVWRPWFDEEDKQNILFASVQGYGKRAPNSSGWVYPGSGATCDTRMVPHPGEDGADEAMDVPADELPMNDSHAAAPDAAPAAGPARAAAGFGAVPEDPDREFVHKEGVLPRTDGPRVINVGVPGPGTRVALWHRAWRDKILPAVVNFAPDLIIVSAGFDAHRKDEINFQYIGVREADFEWITDQIVQVANRCCEGRVVSVLEGGYRIHGKIVSAFSRSVAAHVSALQEANGEVWDEEEAAQAREEERRKREAKAAERERKAAARAARLIAEAQALAAAEAAAEAAPPPPPPGADAAPDLPPRFDSGELPGVSEGEGPALAPDLPGAAAQEPAMDVKSEGGGEGVDAGGSDRKRRRTQPVDYQLLDLQLQAEQSQADASNSGKT